MPSESDIIGQLIEVVKIEGQEKYKATLDELRELSRNWQREVQSALDRVKLPQFDNMMAQAAPLAAIPRQAAAAIKPLNSELLILSRYAHLVPGDIGRLINALTQIGYTTQLATTAFSGAKAALIGMGAGILGVIAFRNEISEAIEGLAKWAGLLEHTSAEFRTLESEQDRFAQRMREATINFDVATGRVTKFQAELAKLRKEFPQTPAQALEGLLQTEAATGAEKQEQATAERVLKARQDAEKAVEAGRRAAAQELLIVAGLAKEYEFIRDTDTRIFRQETERLQVAQKLHEEFRAMVQLAKEETMRTPHIPAQAQESVARVLRDFRITEQAKQLVQEEAARLGLSGDEREAVMGAFGIRQTLKAPATPVGGRSSMTPVSAFTNLGGIMGLGGQNEERRYRLEQLSVLKKIESNTRHGALAA